MGGLPNRAAGRWARVCGPPSVSLYGLKRCGEKRVIRETCTTLGPLPGPCPDSLMKYAVAVCSKKTEKVSQATIEVRRLAGSQYQAIISWQSFPPQAGWGNGADAAVLDAFNQFRRLNVLTGFDVQLIRTVGERAEEGLQ